MSHSSKAQRLLCMILSGLVLGSIFTATPATAATGKPTAQIYVPNCPVAKITERLIAEVTLRNSSSASNRFWVKVEAYGTPTTADYYDLAPGEKKLINSITFDVTKHDPYGVFMTVYLDGNQGTPLTNASFMPSDCSPPPNLKVPSVTYTRANMLAQVNITLKYLKILSVYNVNTGARVYHEEFSLAEAQSDQARTISLNLSQGEYLAEVWGLVVYTDRTFTVTAPAPTTRVTDPRHGLLETRTQWAPRNVVSWEDGTKKNGTWKYGKDHYVTTGPDGIYKINTPNVGNGRGKVSENRVRVTVQYMIYDDGNSLWKKFGEPRRKVVVIRSK